MAEFQTNLAWDTLLELGGRQGRLHARLSGALRAAIRDRRLPAGSALPPSRALAEDLGCSRWIVTEAYAQLAAEGYLDARVGSGTRVRLLGQDDIGRLAPEVAPARAPRIDLAPGLPDLRAFPLARWVAALRSVATTLPHAELGYPDPAGHLRLRQLLAQYLARVRAALLAWVGPFATPSSATTGGRSGPCRGPTPPGWRCSGRCPRRSRRRSASAGR